MDIESFKAALNEAQLAAVTYCDGPSLVIAGAGSGKTRVLTYKIAYLLEMGYHPASILALTFTNKAAREMNTRIAAFCQNANVYGLWSGTFHSIFARILRQECDYIGFKRDFTIYDTSDSRSLLKHIVKELGLDDKKYKPNVVGGRISEAKNHLILPQAYETDASIQKRDHTDGVGEIHKIYRVYQQRLRAAGALDFDDLLLFTYYLLRNNDDVRLRYQEKFQYILVDEYQDTNMAQHRILSLLTNSAQHICVVGDDAQSIYGFRGADIRNILTFQQQYPNSKLFKLECNYRSTCSIVEAANSVISKNLNQIPKKVYSACDEGEKIHVFEAQSDKEEANKIVAHIIRLYKQNESLDEIALLHRTNAQSRVLEEAFQKSGVPYRIYGNLSFYQRKEIKDALAYFRLLINPNDDESLRRIINYPARGIGATTLQKVQVEAASRLTSLWDVLTHLSEVDAGLSNAPKAKLERFVNLITETRSQLDKRVASEVAKEIIMKSGMALEIASDKTTEGSARRENVDELLSSILAYEKEMFENEQRSINLSDFVASISLYGDTTEQEDDGSPRVTIMTIHASKGLEFNSVFITGLEEGLFPTSSANLYPSEMEEERRLFYVALTRAKRHCFLSFSRSRFQYGSMQFSEPSSFIKEIDNRYVQFEGSLAIEFAPERSKYHSDYRDTFASGKSNSAFNYGESKSSSSVNMDRIVNRYNRSTVQPSVPSNFKRVSITPAHEAEQTHTSTIYENQQLQVGMNIKHERFGEGKIIGIEGTDSSTKIAVDFRDQGVKKLLLRFAKIQLA